ncbi:type IV secretion system protein [Taylorella equigenitalis]|uniref:Minor pilin of type IV secretion complex, VirB5 n=1 Tax=Taylorella equigenitalis (strain MCE9) TaxID=937774 RepID=A0A654KF86_TAYEM|nr:type IV secretion system protein [Taylorella equigenitalis]ADU91088.1 Minor pilin of type IV secretion complex, VirB5 [Taylorella equigenitalis MCE9]ASY39597.1 type VI secretion protein [Taylorella equigenitalis]WDU55923.1 type VI secretion protein [Taylorella equigenitalis]VEG31943.1 P-type DNA transfer protein VirB5 [Taylorella equigenitalis ATCC 35865]
MKLSKLFLYTVLSVGFANVHAGGIPVIDTAQLTQEAQNFLKSLAEMKNQVENQIKQITELKAQVSALTSQRGLGNVLRDELKSNIPDSWKEMYGKVGNLDILKGENFDPEGSAKNLVAMLEGTEKSFDSIKERMKKIDELTNLINTTKDIKETGDLQARIQSEQLAITNEQIKLDQLARAYEIQKEVNSKQRIRQETCSLAKWAGRTCE